METELGDTTKSLGRAGGNRNNNNNDDIFYLNTVGFKANIAYGAV